MDLKTMYLYFLCFVALSCETRAMERKALFLRRRNLDGFVGQGYFLDSKATSRIQCAITCMGLGDSECRSFTYEEDRRACYLHRSHWPLPGDSRPGAATFYRKWTHCPQNWDLLDENVCVKLISEKMSWQDALQNCLQLGGNLVSVETQAKESLLRTYLQARNVLETWLGASDVEEEGQWKWEATGDTAHIRWFWTEPNGGTKENCLQMYGFSMVMVDRVCNHIISSVCGIPL